MTTRIIPVEGLLAALRRRVPNGGSPVSTEFREGYAAAVQHLAQEFAAAAAPAPTIPVDGVLWNAMDNGLVWLPEWGLGYSSAALRASGIYDEGYWQSYAERAATPMGRRLTAMRVELVRRHYGDGPLVDVGIGCGHFVETRGGETQGYDVNPVGVQWLRTRGRYCDPYAAPVPAVTLWDVVEHLPEPSLLLDHVRDFAFMTLPLFVDAAHVLRSKHFKRTEHLWYWTRGGLLNWMDAQGFDCLEHGTPESLAGREDIHTFVFRRRR